MERWTGRVAIVTGASAGIGEAIARALAENGLKVVAVARRIEKLQAIASEKKKIKGEFHPVQGDVTKEEDVKRVVKWARDKLGGADVLVNNAGVFRRASVASATAQDLNVMINTNVLGLCFFTREVVKDMRDRGVDDGHIFHISSVAGQRIPERPELYPYSATKHMVMVMTEGLRRELRDMNTKIKITGISPGAVRTEILEAAGLPREVANQHFASHPCLESKDIADALLYALATKPHVQVHEITILPVGAV